MSIVQPNWFEENLEEGASPHAITFTVVTHPKFELHHAMQDQGDGLTKLVYHFKKIAYNDMLVVGEALYHLVHEKLLPPYPIRCLADRSPLADVNLQYRSQWDFIVLNVPAVYVKTYHDVILKTVMSIEK